MGDTAEGDAVSLLMRQYGRATRRSLGRTIRIFRGRKSTSAAAERRRPELRNLRCQAGGSDGDHASSPSPAAAGEGGPAERDRMRAPFCHTRNRGEDGTCDTCRPNLRPGCTTRTPSSGLQPPSPVATGEGVHERVTSRARLRLHHEQPDRSSDPLNPREGPLGRVERSTVRPGLTSAYGISRPHRSSSRERGRGAGTRSCLGAVDRY